MTEKKQSYFKIPSRPLIQPKKLIVQKSSSCEGFGVYALEDINKGEIIEEAVFWDSGLNQNHTNGGFSNISKICYTWTCPCAADGLPTECQRMCSKNGPIMILSGGYIQLYNHSVDPNVKFVYNYRQRYVSVRARCNIPAGEECFHNYGDDYNNFEDF